MFQCTGLIFPANPYSSIGKSNMCVVVLCEKFTRRWGKQNVISCFINDLSALIILIIWVCLREFAKEDYISL